jgi:hypothetical protein
MSNDVKIDVKQRQNLVDLIGQAKRLEQEALERTNDVSEEAILRKYVEEKGYVKMLNDLETLGDKILELKDQRDRLRDKFKKEVGLDVDDSELSFAWYTPQIIRTYVARKMTTLKAPIQKALQKYDTAIAQVWIASSSEELRKSITGVIQIQ